MVTAEQLIDELVEDVIQDLDKVISKVVDDAWNLLTRKQYLRVMIWYVPSKGSKFGQLLATHPDEDRPVNGAMPIQGLDFRGKETKPQMFRKIKDSTRRLPLLPTDR